MKLSIWLAKEGMKAREFARLTGFGEPTISRILSGQRRPEWPTLDRIREVTRGEVTPNDFLPDGPSAAKDAA